MKESVVSKLCAGDQQCLALQIPATPCFLFFFSPRVLLFGDIITPKLLCVTYGQNGSILDLGIVIFTGMFSLLKNFFPWCGPQTGSFGIPWDAC